MAESSRPANRERSRLLFGAKLLVGLALFAWLFIWQDNGRKIYLIFADIDPSYLAILFLMVFGLNLVSCLKWQLFLREYGVRVSVFRLLALYCIGKFFNNFFPSTVGGDIARSYILGREIQSQERSFVSVILERLTGFIALVILAFLFALLNTNLLGQPLIAISFGVVAVAGIAVSMLVVFPGVLDYLAVFLQKMPFLNTVVRKLRLLGHEFNFFRGRSGLLAKALGYSFIFHFMTIVQVYLACLTVNFAPRFLDIALITPIVLMVTSVPLSPNKLGVWEWAFGVFLFQAGGEVPEGVAVALIIRGLGLVVSAMGGVLLISERGHNGRRTSG